MKAKIFLLNKNYFWAMHWKSNLPKLTLEWSIFIIHIAKFWSLREPIRPVHHAIMLISICLCACSFHCLLEPIRLVQPLHNVNMYMFLFCLLDDRIALPTLVCLFFAEGNSSPLLKQQLPKLEGLHDSWHDVTTHSETQTLFCTDSRSFSLGVAEAGTLKLDLRSLKFQNPFFS